MGWRRSSAFAGVLALVAVASGSDVDAAQVEPGVYTGTVANPFGGDVPGSVELNVAGDGTAVTGRLVLLIDSTLDFGGGEEPVCFVVEVTFLSAPLAIANSQAFGDARVVQDIADGACAARAPNEPQESTAPIEIQFEGRQATGELRLELFEAGEQVLTFSATNQGGTGGSGGAGDEDEDGGAADDGEEASRPPPTVEIPGIDELFAGAEVTDATRRRLDQLRCPGPESCPLTQAQRDAFLNFVDNARQRFSGGSLEARTVVGSAGFLALLTDEDGRPLVPSMQRMLPVIVELHRQAVVNDEADFDLAARRLIGLLLVQAIEARG